MLVLVVLTLAMALVLSLDLVAVVLVVMVVLEVQDLLDLVVESVQRYKEQELAAIGTKVAF